MILRSQHTVLNKVLTHKHHFGILDVGINKFLPCNLCHGLTSNGLRFFTATRIELADKSFCDVLQYTDNLPASASEMDPGLPDKFLNERVSTFIN